MLKIIQSYNVWIHSVFLRYFCVDCGIVWYSSVGYWQFCVMSELISFMDFSFMCMES
jgi:hypothetical protein